MRFRATAFNGNGDTFQFWFCNPNWNGIYEVAQKALDDAVEKDAMHKKYGPWHFRNIDVST